MRLDPNLKLRGTEGKYVLKKALEPLVPNSILYRPKQGFSMPLRDWFRGPLRQRVRETIESPEIAETDMFRLPMLRTLVGEHERGARDHSSILWLMLMFGAFLRQSAPTA